MFNALASREDLQVGTMAAIERAATLTTEKSQTEAFVKMSLLTIVFHGKQSENKV